MVDFGGRMSLDDFLFTGSMIQVASQEQAALSTEDATFIEKCIARKKRKGYHKVVYVSMGTNVLPESRFWHILKKTIQTRDVLLVVALGIQ